MFIRLYKTHIYTMIDMMYEGVKEIFALILNTKNSHVLSIEAEYIYFNQLIHKKI